MEASIFVDFSNNNVRAKMHESTSGLKTNAPSCAGKQYSFAKQSMST